MKVKIARLKQISITLKVHTRPECWRVRFQCSVTTG